MIRTADEIPHERMQPLERLPVFFDLAGKRVVVVGDTDGAAWKVDLLAAAGARVDLFSPAACPALRDVAAACERVSVHARGWAAQDFSGAAMIVAAAADESEAEALARAAKAAGAPINIVDRPQFSDFSFGAIVNRSPLVIGVSTGGAAPVFAQAVRGRIETLVPESFKTWAQAAKGWRAEVLVSGLDFLARRDFWRRFTRLAFARVETPPTARDRDALLDEARAATAATARGRVTLVGAGPGDPELLTLKGLRVLAGADVVLFDDLVPPSILDFARREAVRINVGKRGYAPSVKQEEINALLLRLARESKNVVRLKGGDPLIFGRANEEIAALRDAGFAVEIVPGVTAALAGAATLCASLTNRETARRVQFITAHSKDGALPEDFNWSALADRGATTAVYMGNRTLPEFSQRLLEHGADPAIPAYLIERASQPDERVIAGTIADLPGKIAGETIKGPALLLMGWALKG